MQVMNIFPVPIQALSVNLLTYLESRTEVRTVSVNKFGAKIVRLLDEEAKKLLVARELMAFQFYLQVRPYVLDWRKIWTFRWPVKQVHTV
jgi:hypothetical protein